MYCWHVTIKFVKEVQDQHALHEVGDVLCTDSRITNCMKFTKTKQTEA